MNFTTGKYKTSRLIELAHKRDKLIVCFSEQECDRVFKLAQENGRVIHKPITFRTFVNKQYNEAKVQSILIDNLELCLESIAYNVEEVTYEDE